MTKQEFISYNNYLQKSYKEIGISKLFEIRDDLQSDIDSIEICTENHKVLVDLCYRISLVEKCIKNLSNNKK